MSEIKKLAPGMWGPFGSTPSIWDEGTQRSICGLRVCKTWGPSDNLSPWFKGHSQTILQPAHQSTHSSELLLGFLEGCWGVGGARVR